MSLMLATLCINEMEHLPNLYAQHKDWPELAAWVFVESADKMYAEANPELVNHRGLSVDGTSEYLAELARTDPKVVYLPFGFSSHVDPAQGKNAARQCYLDVAERVKPEFVWILDADEFFIKQHQPLLLSHMRSNIEATCYCFRFRNIWHPPSIADVPLFTYEVVGGYWDMPHCHGWRWYPGLHYSNNHMKPVIPDKEHDMVVNRGGKNQPYCVHLGFASNLQLRQAKHRYYVARGEGRRDGRHRSVVSRQAFETWKPGLSMPYGASIVPYDGSIPEVFRVS